MKALTYSVSVNSSCDIFEFVSQGRTQLKKKVIFTPLDEDSNIHILDLVSIDSNGCEDKETESRNGDIDLIINTVANIVEYFLIKFPDRQVFLLGSDMRRIRKYRMFIGSNYHLVESNFSILASMDVSDNIQFESYQKNKPYFSFLIRARSQAIEI